MATRTIVKQPLSGSTHGRGIKVVATASAGTLIHTAQAGTTDDNLDEVWLECVNTDTVQRQLTLEWGGTTAPDDNLVYAIPPKSTVPVVSGKVLRNSLLVRAFGDVANVLTISGHVNKITSV